MPKRLRAEPRLLEKTNIAISPNSSITYCPRSMKTTSSSVCETGDGRPRPKTFQRWYDDFGPFCLPLGTLPSPQPPPGEGTTHSIPNWACKTYNNGDRDFRCFKRNANEQQLYMVSKNYIWCLKKNCFATKSASHKLYMVRADHHI